MTSDGINRNRQRLRSVVVGLAGQARRLAGSESDKIMSIINDTETKWCLIAT